ncbi:MAG: NAD(P)/FAD-dependent oxidoreductase [Hellea sp.]|nr:NAD(P)/FAD-dependent oxidoreductase [Hellea sp.]
MADNYTDLIIVGAGLSGIGAAVHYNRECPGKSYRILEARGAKGGTWDLFRYPGIRSDSDMHTLGYKFKPWKAKKAIADGPSILDYIHETAREHNIDDKITYDAKVVSADWDREACRWTVKTKSGESYRCNFLFMCAGYYSYDEPHNPDIKGEKNFKGPIIHPQLWDENLDYKDKQVVIIGSGATAMTLLPAMAEDAAHVTMVQRTPSYVISRPSKDGLNNLMRKVLPDRWVYKFTRWKNIVGQSFLFKSARRKPEKAKKNLMKWTQKALPDDYPVDVHFNPPYYPWEQRLCLVPDGDLYEAINNGSASIVTGHIDTITKDGIKLKSGEVLETDIIVKATGITINVMGDTVFSIGGKEVHFPDLFNYETMMFEGVPNMASVFGYVNASWTLRADLVAEFMCRLVNHMDKTGTRSVTPIAPDGMESKPWITIFNPGYINRVLHLMPKQGDREPWLNLQDYKRDRKVLPTKDLEGDGLVFGGPAQQAEAAE